MEDDAANKGEKLLKHLKKELQHQRIVQNISHHLLHVA
jgi:hypothetical protein